MNISSGSFSPHNNDFSFNRCLMGTIVLVLVGLTQDMEEATNKNCPNSGNFQALIAELDSTMARPDFEEVAADGASAAPNTENEEMSDDKTMPAESDDDKKMPAESDNDKKMASSRQADDDSNYCIVAGTGGQVDLCAICLISCFSGV